MPLPSPNLGPLHLRCRRSWPAGMKLEFFCVLIMLPVGPEEIKILLQLTDPTYLPDDVLTATESVREFEKAILPKLVKDMVRLNPHIPHPEYFVRYLTMLRNTTWVDSRRALGSTLRETFKDKLDSPSKKSMMSVPAGGHCKYRILN